MTDLLKSMGLRYDLAICNWLCSRLDMLFLVYCNIMEKSEVSSPYIDIIEVGTSPSGKTKIWHVVNKEHGPGDNPGVIKWHGPWRKYVYHSDEAFYDAKCLYHIADFLERVTAEHGQ